MLQGKWMHLQPWAWFWPSCGGFLGSDRHDHRILLPYVYLNYAVNVYIDRVLILNSQHLDLKIGL